MSTPEQLDSLRDRFMHLLWHTPTENIARAYYEALTAELAEPEYHHLTNVVDIWYSVLTWETFDPRPYALGFFLKVIRDHAKRLTTYECNRLSSAVQSRFRDSEIIYNQLNLITILAEAKIQYFPRFSAFDRENISELERVYPILMARTYVKQRDQGNALRCLKLAVSRSHVTPERSVEIAKELGLNLFA